MPKPGEPEMMPHMAGERVFLEDLQVGDVIDVWSKRSGGYFLTEDVEVLEIQDYGHIKVQGGLMLVTDANWGEMRRKDTK